MIIVSKSFNKWRKNAVKAVGRLYEKAGPKVTSLKTSKAESTFYNSLHNFLNNPRISPAKKHTQMAKSQEIKFYSGIIFN